MWQDPEILHRAIERAGGEANRKGQSAKLFMARSTARLCPDCAEEMWVRTVGDQSYDYCRDCEQFYKGE
jgi:hypothetical protein